MKKLLLFLIIPFLSFSQIVTEDCSSIPDPGICFAAIEIYYFNQNTGQCEASIWGGCDGLVPFWTLENCQNSCGNTDCDQDLDNDEICDEVDDCVGTWIADITAGDCTQFTSQGADVCNSYSGCEWVYSWGGWVTGGSSDCVGNYEFDNGYCDEFELITSGCDDEAACNYDGNPTINEGGCEYPGDLCEGFDLNLQELVYGILDDNCECGLPLSIDMFLKPKKIITTVNMVGQKSQINSNEKILIHIYDDGSVEKKYLTK